MALTARQLENYRRILTATRQELAFATGRAETAVNDQVDLDRLDYGDRATSAVAKEALLQEAGRESEQLAEIEAALRRIEQGSYGTCVECGCAIPGTRLDALPWAALCVHDQAISDERGRTRASVPGGAPSRVVA